jgi:hypothetical protein
LDADARFGERRSSGGDVVTLQRALVCVSILGLFACVRSDAAPKARRPVPTSEPVAAVVLHVGGATTVRPVGGAPFAAAVDHDLVRSDRLDPAEGAFAIVGLPNGYVVRVDDAGALAVKDILLLDAPMTTRPVDAQLAALLEPGERGAGLEKVAERAAAWRQMRRAGETGGRGSSPREESTAGAEGASVADSGAPVTSNERRAAAPSPAATAMPAPAKDVPPPIPSVAGGAPAGPPPPAEPAAAKKKPDVSPQRPAPPPAPTEPGVIVTAGRSVTAATPLSPSPSLGGGVRACLEQTARDLGVAPDRVTLWLEVEGGVVTRVRFAGALPVSACAAALRGRSVAVADGWLVVGRAP